MARSLQHDPLADAFWAIANTGATIPPHCLSALDIALRQTANDMRLAGRPVERVVAHVKSLATETGIRDSHDRLVQDALLWAITYFCGEKTRFEPNQSPARYSRRSNERTVPLEVGVESPRGSSRNGIVAVRNAPSELDG
jgi:hypothetical protein